jgi:hypothetical protein
VDIIFRTQLALLVVAAAVVACSGGNNESSDDIVKGGAGADTAGSGAVSAGSGGIGAAGGGIGPTSATAGKEGTSGASSGGIGTGGRIGVAGGAGAGAGGLGGGGGTSGTGAGGIGGTSGAGAGGLGGGGGTSGTAGSGGKAGSGGTGGSGGGVGQAVSDDFERATLGSTWEVVYPTGADKAQVQLLASSDLGMLKGNQAFFLIDWVGNTFSADQYCEATMAQDAPAGWAYMVYVRRRTSDGARYGFVYDNDPSQPNYGDWIFKYDGVPGPQTRVFASVKATTIPKLGDTLRVEIVGYTLKGYLNGGLVLQATDTDATKIANGRPGLAARLATGNASLGVDSKVWEAFAAGDL